MKAHQERIEILQGYASPGTIQLVPLNTRPPLITVQRKADQQNWLETVKTQCSPSSPGSRPPASSIPEEGTGFIYQAVIWPQVHLLHQGAGEVVTQGDNAERELREGEKRKCQVRTCTETLEGTRDPPGPPAPAAPHPEALTHLPPSADILLLEVLQVDHGLPAHQGLLVVHRLGDKAEHGS